MPNYYNENDPKAAAWIRELIADGLIPEGKVDERSITDVRAADLRGFTQCHFFAGITGWPYALRLANWGDERPVWTGSAPCQPLSCAGKQEGHADKRHLWPAFYELIAQCRPAIVFGEQVAGALGREWFAGVRLDLEDTGYACGGADLCAAGVGAPHIRQRLYWMANYHRRRRSAWSGEQRGAIGAGNQDGHHAQRRGGTGGVGNSSGAGSGRDTETVSGSEGEGSRERETTGRLGDESVDAGTVGRLADAKHDGGRTDEQGWGQEGRETDGRISGVANLQRAGLEGHAGNVADGHEPGRNGADPAGSVAASGQPRGFWDDFEILHCTDGKARRIEPGTFPLVAGVSSRVVPGGDPGVPEAQASAEGRVMRLRGYGNAICVPLAVQFILATQEALDLTATV